MIVRYDLVHYVSGPMTGIPEHNYPAFQSATIKLRRLGLKVISPHEIPAPPIKIQDQDKLWQYYMDRCMEQMNECQAFVMLKGWPKSRGAMQEFTRAQMEEWEAFYFYQENPGKLIEMH